jgi:hypothetical protein
MNTERRKHNEEFVCLMTFGPLLLLRLFIDRVAELR